MCSVTTFSSFNTYLSILFNNCQQISHTHQFFCCCLLYTPHYQRSCSCGSSSLSSVATAICPYSILVVPKQVIIKLSLVIHHRRSLLRQGKDRNVIVQVKNKGRVGLMTRGQVTYGLLSQNDKKGKKKKGKPLLVI